MSGRYGLTQKTLVHVHLQIQMHACQQAREDTGEVYTPISSARAYCELSAGSHIT